MAELAILPRCSTVELRSRLLDRRRHRGKIRLLLSPPPGNAQKDTLNGNFAALGDNWALRRHVIIPATAAKAGALLKLLEFMDSVGEQETSRTSKRASSANFSSFGRRLWPSFSTTRRIRVVFPVLL